MNTVEILKKARALITKKKNWTQGYYFRDAKGRETDCFDDEASCFCAIGALAKVQGIPPHDAIPGASELALIASHGVERAGYIVARFNDDHTHAEVLDLFDRAIARAESEAA